MPKSTIEAKIVDDHELGEVVIPNEVDFVYVMRTDQEFTMAPIAERLATEIDQSPESVKQVLIEKYNLFFKRLSHTIMEAFSEKGQTELHVYNPERLDTQVRNIAGDTPLISLDPLISEGVHSHQVSRGYFLGGKVTISQINRPGSEPMEVQSQLIAEKLAGLVAMICEDDVFSGGSLVASLLGLLDSGISISGVISGIQVGHPDKLTELGIEIKPAVMYKTEDGSDIFDKLDLGDPRDFLIGGSGLAVKLPDGTFGRAPYIQPFVSASARASIPADQESSFSAEVLYHNLQFFEEVETELNQPILLKHMDPYFVNFMAQVFDFDGETSMVEITSWAIMNQDLIWKYVQAEGEFQQGLARLELPQKMIMLDVNGTLFSDDSPDGFIEEEDKVALLAAIEQKKQQGYVVGLCSDSPELQLAQFAETLKIDGPIISENANMVTFQDQELVINPFPEQASYMDKVQEFAQYFGMEQVADCVAPEFGGKAVNYEQKEWAFGANRLTSISVFGPSDFILELGAELANEEGISIDCAPQDHFLAIHKGSNFRDHKGKLLAHLAKYQYNVTMIGNSNSDWVDPASGVKCAFVGDSRASKDVQEQAEMVSTLPYSKGVVEILNSMEIA